MGEILKEPSKKPVKSRKNRSGESSNTVSRQLVEHLSSANDNQAGQTESKQLKNPGIMRFPGFSYTQVIKMPAMSEAKKKANGL